MTTNTTQELLMIPEVLTTTETISPVTLSPDWSRVARLLLLTGMSVVGSVGNVFMISAVMIEDHLKKRGNVFLVNAALSDLLITGLVFPASTVVILAGAMDNSLAVCNFQWFLALLSCLVSILTLTGTAVENYARLCLPPECYDCLSPTKVTLIIFSIWIASTATVTVQFIYDLGPDYCRKTSQGLLPYQITMGTLFIFLPLTFTFVCFVLILFRVRTYRSIPSFKPPLTFTFDYELVITNIVSFVFFVLFWLPFLIVLCSAPIQSSSRRLFYNLAWFALSKSCISNLIYCITNRHFRNAYVNLFHYCCCKTTVSISRRTREPARPIGDVRVHILSAYNMYTSPQRSREMGKFTSSSSRASANGRDVYEL